MIVGTRPRHTYFCRERTPAARLADAVVHELKPWYLSAKSPRAKESSSSPCPLGHEPFCSAISAIRSKLAGEARFFMDFWTYHGRAVHLVAGHFSLLFFSNRPLPAGLGTGFRRSASEKPQSGQEPHQKQPVRTSACGFKLQPRFSPQNMKKIKNKSCCAACCCSFRSAPRMDKSQPSAKVTPKTANLNLFAQDSGTGDWVTLLSNIDQEPNQRICYQPPPLKLACSHRPKTSSKKPHNRYVDRHGQRPGACPARQQRRRAGGCGFWPPKPRPSRPHWRAP